MASTRAGAGSGALDLLAAAAALRWVRPDLTAALADHVLDVSAAEQDAGLWWAASGWAVHARAAVGDGRDEAVHILESAARDRRDPGVPAARRLRVELAALAVTAEEPALARELVASVIGPGAGRTPVSGSPDVPDDEAALLLHADAVGVLARCAVEDAPHEVDALLARGRDLWSSAAEPAAEVGAASLAVVAAAAARRAGRPGDAVDEAADGLARLERGRGTASSTAPSNHVAAALAAEWLSALTDAGRFDQAREGSLSLGPRLAGPARPTRQLARLRLAVARAQARSEPSEVICEVLERAVADAAASDAPDLDSVCRSMLGVAWERSGRLDAALETMRVGVLADRRDQTRRTRLRDALAALPASALRPADPLGDRVPRSSAPIGAPPPAGRDSAPTGEQPERRASSSADDVMPRDRRGSASQPADATGRAGRTEHDERPARAALAGHEEPVRRAGAAGPDQQAARAGGPERDERIGRAARTERDEPVGRARQDERSERVDLERAARPTDDGVDLHDEWDRGGRTDEHPLASFTARAEVSGRAARAEPVGSAHGAAPAAAAAARPRPGNNGAGAERADSRPPRPTRGPDPEDRPTNGRATRRGADRDRPGDPRPHASRPPQAEADPVIEDRDDRDDWMQLWAGVSADSPIGESLIRSMRTARRDDGPRDDVAAAERAATARGQDRERAGGPTSARGSEWPWPTGGDGPPPADRPAPPRADADRPRPTGRPPVPGPAPGSGAAPSSGRPPQTAGPARPTTDDPWSTGQWGPGELIGRMIAREARVDRPPTTDSGGIGGPDAEPDRVPSPRRRDVERPPVPADVPDRSARADTGPTGMPVTPPTAPAAEPDGTSGWLQRALADLDRALGRPVPFEPRPAPAPPAEPPVPPGDRFSVVVDVVRGGRRVAGEPVAALLRAIGRTLVERLPAGARLGDDTGSALTVVVEGRPAGAVTEWMHRTVPGLLADIVVVDLPDAQLRAEVHGGDGPVGAQILQRLAGPPPRPERPSPSAGGGIRVDAGRQGVGRHLARTGAFLLNGLAAPAPGSGGRRHRPAEATHSSTGPDSGSGTGSFSRQAPSATGDRLPASRPAAGRSPGDTSRGGATDQLAAASGRRRDDVPRDRPDDLLGSGPRPPRPGPAPSDPLLGPVPDRAPEPTRDAYDPWLPTYGAPGPVGPRRDENGTAGHLGARGAAGDAAEHDGWARGGSSRPSTRGLDDLSVPDRGDPGIGGGREDDRSWDTGRSSGASRQERAHDRWAAGQDDPDRVWRQGDDHPLSGGPGARGAAGTYGEEHSRPQDDAFGPGGRSSAPDRVFGAGAAPDGGRSAPAHGSTADRPVAGRGPDRPESSRGIDGPAERWGALEPGRGDRSPFGDGPMLTDAAVARDEPVWRSAPADRDAVPGRSGPMNGRAGSDRGAPSDRSTELDQAAPPDRGVGSDRGGPLGRSTGVDRGLPAGRGAEWDRDAPLRPAAASDRSAPLERSAGSDRGVPSDHGAGSDRGLMPDRDFSPHRAAPPTHDALIDRDPSMMRDARMARDAATVRDAAAARDAAARDAAAEEAAARDAAARDAAVRDAAARDSAARDAASRDATTRDATTRDAAGARNAAATRDDTAGLGLADLLAGALAAYRGI